MRLGDGCVRGRYVLRRVSQGLEHGGVLLIRLSDELFGRKLTVLHSNHRDRIGGNRRPAIDVTNDLVERDGGVAAVKAPDDVLRAVSGLPALLTSVLSSEQQRNTDPLSKVIPTSRSS